MSGFGLAHMLEARDLIDIARPLPHLYSLADTLLYSPEYVAPEVAEGAPADARSDIYSLGVVLYELLCGKPPFAGEDLTAVVTQHVKRTAPPLHEVYPEAPAALDFVVQRALDRDPGRRFQSAARLSQAFEGVINVLNGAEKSAPEQADDRLFDISQRPTLHWFEAESSPGIQWNPPISPTEAHPVVDIASAPARPATPPTLKPDTPPSVQAAGQQRVPSSPLESMRTAQQQRVPSSPLVSVGAPLNTRPPVTVGGSPSNMAPQNQQNMPQVPAFMPSVADVSKKVSAPKPKKQRLSRRSVLIASGGVVATTGLAAAGGFAYLRFIKPMKQPMRNAAPAQNKKSIGSTKQAVNSTSIFTNPADNKASLLVRLANGQFVAFESACTHQGVTVYLDQATQKLVCPLHGAVFDPANNAAVLQGPAVRPLLAVTIHVQADGSITV
jgi:serine/threonine-protein kinase